MLCFRVTSVIQAQEHLESLNYLVYLGNSQKPNVAGLSITSRSPNLLTHFVYGRMTLLLSFPIPHCCKIIGQKHLELEGVWVWVCVAGGW